MPKIILNDIERKNVEIVEAWRQEVLLKIAAFFLLSVQAAESTNDFHGRDKAPGGPEAQTFRSGNTKI